MGKGQIIRQVVAQEHMQAEERAQMQLAMQMQQQQQAAAMHQQFQAEIRQIGMKLYIERMQKLIDSDYFDDLTEAEAERIAFLCEMVSVMLHDAYGHVTAKPWAQAEVERKEAKEKRRKDAEEKAKSPIVQG
jgi:hypothetical protein